MTRGLRLKETYRGVLDKVVSRDVAEELLSGEIELGGEMREATVLFADLRGFTALTEHMDPHAVVALLNGCMERLTAAVEEEGGVVDKYVGDELMAVFGAPVSRGDDAMRACRAAERMTASLEAMNRERAARDEPPVGAGVGIGTGLVVAGNMGTTRRLNYTVLGSTVNLAARIGDAARAGEVLLSRGTVDAVGDRVLVEALPAMALRGFSRPVEVFRLVRTAVSAAALLAVLALALALAPAASRAQEGLPTLSDLGLRYRSPSGSVELQLSGRLDLETYLPGDEPSWIVPSTDPFFAARARTFADLFVGDRLRATVELRVDRGEEPAAGDYEARIDQAYASARPFAGADLLVQVGKFASPFGGYAARHHTTRDPFVRPPLAYDWRTTIPTRQAPADLAEMVALRSPVNRTRARGAPIVWGVPYQWGAQVLANLAGFSLRGATVTSAPAGAPRTWELDADAGLGSAWVVGIARQLGASLQVDLSWSRGPYLTEDVSGIPAGRAFDDYRQTILGVEAIYARGPFVLRGELFDDTWEVPNLDRDLGDLSWYVEGQWDVRAGLFAAARYGSTSFESVPGSGDEGWDWDVRRIELAAGYRVARNLGIQAEVAFNRTPGAARDPSDDLAAIQLWWSY
jgi:class 3 adenylate cyclase